MDSQITLRLPKELARALTKRAKARGVPKSQLVREAVARYVAEPEPLSDEEFRARYDAFVGSATSAPGAHEAAMTDDPMYRQIYENNFRPE